MTNPINRLRCYYGFLFIYIIFQIIFLNVLRSYNQDTHTNAMKILELYKRLLIKLNENSQTDSSGLYKIITKNTEAPINESKHDVTIVSQCSSNHFSHVEDLFKIWTGPISIAIYSEVAYVEKTLWDMSRFIYCHKSRNFNMQLVVPFLDFYVEDFKFAYDLLSANDKSVSCDSPFLLELHKQVNYNWSLPYPVNLLRNVAKMQSSTDYILVIDVDLVPNVNLRENFLDFVKSEPTNSDKVVYVVPTFEAHLDVPPPQTKLGLLQMIELNKARPFYVEPCEDCQKLTKYEDWLTSDNYFEMKVLHQVEWKHPWEPFFIARRDVPDFDERFRQYGMNRVSQICELHMAGYNFLVLDNAFLIHKGFKSMETFHISKNKEMLLNRKIYNWFKIEVKYRYQDSKRRC